MIVDGVQLAHANWENARELGDAQILLQRKLQIVPFLIPREAALEGDGGVSGERG